MKINIKLKKSTLKLRPADAVVIRRWKVISSKKCDFHKFTRTKH